MNSRRKGANLTGRSLALSLLLLLLAAVGVEASPGASKAMMEPGAPPAATSAGQGTDGIPEGAVLIEGDILVAQDFLDGLGPDAIWLTNLWPGGVVPYEFNANVLPQNRQRMVEAMAEWEAVANVAFVPRSDEPDYVHIQAASVNSSYVGRIGGGQVLNIYNWTWRFIMVHELGHALGLLHEQSRLDRDWYVRIEEECIQPGQGHNFMRFDSADIYPKRAYGLADEQTYDFDSVMHYTDDAFLDTSKPGCVRTITVLPPNEWWQTRIGQLDHLSELDQLTMSFLYPEEGWYFVDRWAAGSYEQGTLSEPYTTLPGAASAVPDGSTLWVQPGSYPALGTYDKPMTLRAPLGGVTLGLEDAPATGTR